MSCFGLMGVEDFGGGMLMKFVLESGFLLVDGLFQGGMLFYWQVYVLLQNVCYGDLWFGW